MGRHHGVHSDQRKRWIGAGSAYEPVAVFNILHTVLPQPAALICLRDSPAQCTGVSCDPADTHLQRYDDTEPGERWCSVTMGWSANATSSSPISCRLRAGSANDASIELRASVARSAGVR